MSTDASGGSTLELRGVTKRFGGSTVVDSLDLVLRPGEFVSLLGPSGCGKTTTLRMIAGFEQPDSGSILLDGAEIGGLPANKREVNTVFQSYALFPHLTVAGNVAYGLRQRRVAKAEIAERVAETLQLVRLDRFADRKPAQLSGGQQQRVALARALVNRPRVLLLDEPLAALDRQLREEVQIELRLIQTRLRTTFLFVTHDQGEALAMSDRVAIMNGGRIEQLDEPETVYERPATRFVAGFVGQQNFFDDVRTDAGVLVDADGVRFLPASAPPAGAAATVAIRPEAITLRPESAEIPVNACAGVVEAVNTLGDSRQYVIRAASGRTLVTRSARVTEPQRFSPGERVLASWSPDHVAVFPAASAA
ncbi:ABC transporter ATP-binding protein [Agromyces mediolanus]|uniref:Spermidine/putrescine import ATP-binding protein PotA n=1 Tax=Agromyces mediolanus TaxID=41986 RepID=A0A918KVT4_AGRME|nr:ABC transporter ATP-binding protein [Agromyces mediolanus]GGR35869.1 spermidine/putrescine import ATP-binding protein PotA [Agromyces mediolanus]GLJ73069.1 spermidine/putrescine import ATP-binding protein PotA [Agromyces mediolanus]